MRGFSDKVKSGLFTFLGMSERRIHGADITQLGRLAKSYSEKSVSDSVKVEGAEENQEDYIKVEPTKIPWDRQGFSGQATVSISLQPVGPNGDPRGDSVSAPYAVDIGPETRGTPDGGDDLALNQLINILPSFASKASHTLACVGDKIMVLLTH
ncbi:hypothetical protein H8E65_08400 [Candidatus Bathyarchaeota archaeon]|nr:hypothetical protein [Candidatus Bathyarchaeota archaeon]MBL7080462.1 hypothetical protein [Candidatus Bathyarchaeota archaeon]